MIMVSVNLIISLTIAILVSGSILTPSLFTEQETFAQQNGNGTIQMNNEEERSNKAVVLALTEAFNQRNTSALDDLVAQDIIEHRPGIQSGLNSTKQFLNSLITAFPDFQSNIDHIVAEGDKVIVFTTTNGTHQGPFIFAPVPPTGKQVSFKTADIYRIENGKIAEHWDVIEILDLLREIGAITFSAPSPTP